jgi:tetratricopeptide (TPR) repeat protein
MDKSWFEERLKNPFVYGTRIEIPEAATADQLQELLDSIGWQREGKTPLLIYEKTKEVKIDRAGFWFKLGMLLYDSQYYNESYEAFSRVITLKSSTLYIFTAYTWLGHLKDLMGEREEALIQYKKALEFDTGDTMTHSQYRMRINRQWVEKRLAMPFMRN